MPQVRQLEVFFYKIRAGPAVLIMIQLLQPLLQGASSVFVMCFVRADSGCRVLIPLMFLSLLWEQVGMYPRAALCTCYPLYQWPSLDAEPVPESMILSIYNTVISTLNGLGEAWRYDYECAHIYKSIFTFPWGERRLLRITETSIAFFTTTDVLWCRPV